MTTESRGAASRSSTWRRNGILLGIAVLVLVGAWALLVLRPWIAAKDLDLSLNDRTGLPDELYAMTVEASFQRDGLCWFRGPARREFALVGPSQQVLIVGKGTRQCGEPDRTPAEVTFVVGNGTAVITAVGPA